MTKPTYLKLISKFIIDYKNKPHKERFYRRP